MIIQLRFIYKQKQPENNMQEWSQLKNEKQKEIIQTLCRMCDDHCGINVYKENGRIIDIEGNKNHPWNKGKLCIKGKAGLDMVYHPERILKPLKKTKNGWKEIKLKQALNEIAERMLEIKRQYGAESLCIWKGEAVGFAQQELLARRFCHAFGTPNYLSNDSQCFNGRYIGYSLVCGMWPTPDYINSECIILWGCNPPNAHPFMTRDILSAKKNGAKLIVIDSRLSEIAAKADIFVQLKPGTDGAFALGIINLLIENKCFNKHFIDNYTVGFSELTEYSRKFTPDYVENETGVSSDKLKNIASLLCERSPKITNYVGNGLEHHENGVNNIRAVACIDVLCGSLDVKGGNLMSEGLDMKCLTLYDEISLKHLKPIGADKFPVLYDFRQECHTMTAMDTMLSEKPYPLKGMILTAANPVMTNPNTEKVKKALKNLELLVVRDLFLTETAEFADYVLPAASFFERSELFVHTCLQLVGLTKKVIDFPECQNEYDFWHDLSNLLGIERYFPWKNEEELNEWLLKPTEITIEKLYQNPEGIRYKPRRYFKWETIPFNTPSGKVEFYSKYLKDLGYTALPEYISPTYKTDKNKEYPYILITGARKLFYYHSRNFNFPRFRKIIPNPEVEIHPRDAEELNVKDGDLVEVTSSVGTLKIPVKIMKKTKILPGVIQITHGWKEANVNLITHDDINDPIDGFPLMKSVQVKIKKIN
jgi:anaerobic selenocysteine-containing dehydrogenase